MKPLSNRVERIKIYPGYPSKRLLIDSSFPENLPIDLPDGPWTVSYDELPSPSETKDFIEAGYEIDSIGRPLHPQWKQMLTDKSCGAIIGKGKYYYWGPNYTADPIVIAGTINRKVLLIKRCDTGDWALPGGFVDKDEQPIQAAIRELGEETGLIGVGKPDALVFSGAVSDLRTTIHSWADTSAYLWNINDIVELSPGDDAADAAWFSEQNLPDNLHGSHANLIKLALEYKQPETLEEILDMPSELLGIRTASGGHMAYRHLLVDAPSDNLFIKAYDPEQFTDQVRRQHSLDYLHKEDAVLRYLSSNNYGQIPKRFELIQDKLLVMDAFKTEDGWYWRRPKSKTLVNKYISDVLAAFEKLHKVPLSIDDISEGVDSTRQILQTEGWDSIDADILPVIIEKVTKLSKQFDKRLQNITLDLIDNIDNIRNISQLKKQQYLVLSHNDARQANIAWHPDFGVKLVDWSWADASPQLADETMFLIDLAKSGFDVQPYLKKYFDKDYAKTLIGFWLAHSILPTHYDNDDVRMQQVASAAEAYDLINKL